MTTRVCALVLVLGCGLATTGCGDDDSGDENGSPSGGSGSAGRSSGDAGMSSGDAGISSGSAGRSSSAGMGGGGAGQGSGSAANELIACDMMAAMGMTATDCQGLDDYTQCALDNCGLQDCLDSECEEYVACVQGAADPCNNDCTQSGACMNCFADQADCIGNMCIHLIMCGETMAGGACDQLDECCDSMSGQMQTVCMQAAAGARAAGGDAVCQTALDALCM